MRWVGRDKAKKSALITVVGLLLCVLNPMSRHEKAYDPEMLPAAINRGLEKKGAVPSADRISSIESVTECGTKWTVPDFFTAPRARSPYLCRTPEGWLGHQAAVIN